MYIYKAVPIAFFYILLKAAQVFKVGRCSSCHLGMKLQALKSY